MARPYHQLRLLPLQQRPDLHGKSHEAHAGVEAAPEVAARGVVIDAPDVGQLVWGSIGGAFFAPFSRRLRWRNNAPNAHLMPVV